jgi:XTP/dITP diphosphohydrolase
LGYTNNWVYLCFYIPLNDEIIQHNIKLRGKIYPRNIFFTGNSSNMAISQEIFYRISKILAITILFLSKYRMHKIVLASNNAGKIREFQQIFAALNIEIVSQASLNVPEIDEPFNTFVENSLHKARHCAKFTGLPALADDSGLCVNVLDGAPGIYSARYAGEPKSDQANLNKLLKVMTTETQRSAYFYCSLVFVRNANDPQPIIAEGIFNGEIAHQARGTNGHGYDPIFYVPEHNASVAELDEEIKNQISHRGKAITELITKLTNAKLI